MGSFVAASRDGSERGGIRPKGLRDEDLGVRTVVAVSCHHFILLILLIFSSKFSVLREGVCRGTRGGHTPPAPFLLQLGRSNEDAVPQKEDRAGPET